MIHNPDSTTSVDDDLDRPFPSLTGAQRLHLEVHGYVLIENAISSDLTQRLLSRLYEIEEDVTSNGPGNYPGSHFGGNSRRPITRENFRVDNTPHLDQSFLDYVSHPTILGIAEEALGGPARLDSSSGQIRRPEPGLDYFFHRVPFTFLGGTQDGLYFYPHVTVLTNLTDLGPDDGGTAVIPGTHKLTQLTDDELITAARKDPSLIHTVEAPAGSALLFYETLIHSPGLIQSDRDRALVTAWYTPPMFVARDEGYEPYPPFLDRIPEAYRPLLDGTRGWFDWPRRGDRARGGPRTRRLDQP